MAYLLRSTSWLVYEPRPTTTICCCECKLKSKLFAKTDKLLKSVKLSTRECTLEHAEPRYRDTEVLNGHPVSR